MTGRKPGLLILGQVPPPVHGTTLMNAALVESAYIRERFEMYHINPPFSRRIDEIGRIGWYKIRVFLRAWVQQVVMFCTRPIEVFYCPVGVNRAALFRDLVFIGTALVFGKRAVLKFDGVGLVAIYKRAPWLFRWWMRLVFRGVSGGLILSSRLAFDVRPFVRDDRLYVVPNGIADLQPGGCRAERRGDGRVVVLFLSNMVREKGVLTLLEAATRVVCVCPEADFVFAGAWFEADVKAEFEAMVGRHRLEDRVRYVGPVYGEEKVRVFREADVFAVPTWRETFGIANVEAMCMGLPVVTTNVGGVPDVVLDGETGYVVEPRNPELLAARLVTLIQDGERRAEMGRQGRERFLRMYTLERWERRLTAAMLRAARYRV